jgi:hypothetical protein
MLTNYFFTWPFKVVTAWGDPVIIGGTRHLVTFIPTLITKGRQCLQHDQPRTIRRIGTTKIWLVKIQTAVATMLLDIKVDSSCLLLSRGSRKFYSDRFERSYYHIAREAILLAEFSSWGHINVL